MAFPIGEFGQYDAPASVTVKFSQYETPAILLIIFYITKRQVKIHNPEVSGSNLPSAIFIFVYLIQAGT